MDTKTVQRTLVITFGARAAETGEEVRRLLGADGQPAAAVALVRGEDLAGMKEQSLLGAAIERISRAGLRHELAQMGWTIDRLDELGLIALVDVTEEVAGVGQAIAAAREVTRDRLGVGAGAQLLALCPEPCEPARGRLRELLADAAFDRGAIALSRSRRDGLRLESETELATATARLAQALIVSPLRDAPAGDLVAEELDEWEPAFYLSDDEGPDPGSALTMGIARWVWLPAAAWEELARRWATESLGAWLVKPEAAPEGLAGQAFAWLEGRGAPPEAMAAAAAEGLPDPPALRWQAPQPWAIRVVLDQLRALAPADKPVVAAEAPASMLARMAGWVADLRTECRGLLEDAPVGGWSRATFWVKAVQSQTSELLERVFTWQEREETAASEQARQAAELDETLATLLADWPADDLVGWLRSLARPWRWPRLAVTYVALNRGGQALRELVATRADLACQQAITTAILEIFTGWTVELERLTDQLEEIGEMLQSVRAGLQPADEAIAPLALYAHLADDPIEEAVRASVAIGGLARQLDAIDDAFVNDLMAAGRARFAVVKAMDAVAALPFFFPTPEAAADWWRGLGEDATPLWPAGDDPLGRGVGTAIILSPNPAGLEALVGEEALAGYRRLPSPDGNAVVVVRMAAIRV